MGTQISYPKLHKYYHEDPSNMPEILPIGKGKMEVDIPLRHVEGFGALELWSLGVDEDEVM